MSILGATLKEGTTAVSFTGGTDAVYNETASTGAGKVTSVTAVADYRERPLTIHTAKNPTYNAATGTWSKGSMKMVHKRPKLDADDRVVFPLARLEVEVHPIMSIAEIDDIWEWIAMVATHADYADFRRTGSMG